ncbi:MAG TPA: sigma 54-interacting transcriptional regulator [Planctomycetota bacterium]|nr:sigma 54-interacting transcriptional regulator [Planctomycetota bacterium]
MGRIFICYRREDSADITGRIYDRLEARFGAGTVFMDIDTIPYGADFRKNVDQELRQCELFLAVIGSGFLVAKGARKRPRLKSPKDFVRIEIETALARNIPIIPVLVHGVRMPEADALPPTLRELAGRQAAEVGSGSTFRLDVNRLINSIEHRLEPPSRAQRKPSATNERILIVDDDWQTADALRKNLLFEGYHSDVAGSPPEALEAMAKQSYTIVLSDMRMTEMSGVELCDEIHRLYPDVFTVIITGYGSIPSAVEAVKRGAYDYLTKPTDTERLLSVLQRLAELRTLRDDNQALREQIQAERRAARLIGSSPPMTRVMATIRAVARTDAPVLVRGERGTGKELVASTIHELSARAKCPFVKVDCACMPEALLEDELFGHEREAYPGAHAQRKGRLEIAQGGTIFLDEVVGMLPAVQARLLRVLQEREFERVGGSQTISVDVRVIASTSRNLEKAVRAGDFREDLYYGIRVVPILLPPLRERREDILAIASFFLEHFATRSGRSLKGFTRMARKRLLDHGWPGNVRELENCIQRSVVVAQGDKVGIGDIALDPSLSPEGADDIASTLVQPGFSIEDFERRLIEAGLRKTGGNPSCAAELLGLTRRTLLYRMEKYDIQLNRGHAPEEN